MGDPQNRADAISRAYDLHVRAAELAQQGHHEEAISAENTAIGILRDQEETGAPVAGALTNLATFLAASGHFGEALDATEQAVAIFRRMSDVDADSQPHLAAALANLGTYVAELGRPAEALGPTKEALSIRRRLAGENPGEYNSELAASLNNLGWNLLTLDRADEALPAAEESVRMRRLLAEADPGHYGRVLARSLRTLADALIRLDRAGEALPLAEEAVNVLRSTHASGGGYQTELADSLEKLTKVLASMNLPVDALPVAQEAIRIRRALAEADPDRHKETLALCLTNAGAAFSKMDQLTAGLGYSREAVDLYHTLSTSDAEKYSPGLALSLNNLGSILYRLGQAADALPHARDAVLIRRRLANTDDEKYLPDLAHSLVNLGPILAALRKHDEALSISREAVELYQGLAEDNPSLYHSEVARAQDALSIAEAAQSYRADTSSDKPLPRWPIVTITGPDATEGLDGPRVMTFTCQLPFPLGLAGGGSYFISASGQWLDPDSAQMFGEHAFVVIRLCSAAKGANDPWPHHASEVLKELYGYEMPSGDASEGASPAHEQWVTLETPDARLDTDDPRDDGFAFHRCLEVLSRYLRAHYQIFKDVRVRAITTHDVGPVVFRGAYTLQEEREWHYLGAMFMHPDSYPDDPEHKDPKESLDELLGAYGQLDLHPFMTSAEWLRRAEYARRYSGDNTEVVISLQISMESMLYRTWGMLLIDQGKPYADVIEAINSTTGYRQLLVRIFPALLGGRWDIEAPDTPVGTYWKRLYELRNNMVHGGHRPSWPEAEAAYEAYIGMREFINERLWAKHKKYPRTLLAKIGYAGLQRRGWDSRWMREFSEKALAQPGFFYLAHDLAGRPATQRP
jgi:Tetratricopeptide repeat